MPRIFARFAAAPIGPQLAVSDGGLTLLTLDDNGGLARAARSDVEQAGGIHGAEFTFWGDAALSAVVGIMQPAATLGAMPGATSQGVGWKINTGEVFVSNAVVANGLPVVSKGHIVGLRVLLDGGAPTLEFYHGANLVHSRALPAGASWHFAVSLASPVAGTLVAAVNAGQWQAQSPAAKAGWQQPAPAVVMLRLSDVEFLTAGTDAPAHARYEGIIDQAGIQTTSALAFWPWGGDAPVQGAVARVRVLDAEGFLDALAQSDAANIPVAVRMGTADGTLAAAIPIARFVCDAIEVEGDGYKTLHLRDAHDDLDELLTRGVFLPSIPALAWRVQPAVIGAVASIPALFANSDGSVAFLSDAPLFVDTVRDRGDAMEPGMWSMDPGNQQLLLSSPPAGPMVVDASSIGAGMQPATLNQTLREIFRRIDKSAWSWADAAALDSATGYAGIGYYAQGVSVRAALSAILPSYGAWWWQDADGVLRFARTVNPDTVAQGALAFDLVAEDLHGDLIYIPDNAPNLTRRMAYQPNAQVLGLGDLVTDMVDVPPARRLELTEPWRSVVYGAGVLPVRYAHADIAAPFVSVFWNRADAQAEIDRVLALYAVPRYLYRWMVKGDLALAPKPGQVGRITYPRYGLSAGRQVLVRAVERNPATGDVVLTLWGA